MELKELEAKNTNKTMTYYFQAGIFTFARLLTLKMLLMSGACIWSTIPKYMSAHDCQASKLISSRRILVNA